MSIPKKPESETSEEILEPGFGPDISTIDCDELLDLVAEPEEELRVADYVIEEIIEVDGPAKPLVMGLLDTGEPEVHKRWASEVLKIGMAHRYTQGEGTVGCVLDTGADLNHPDLAHAIIGFKNFVPGSSNSDLDGHSTHCAGIIAGGGGIGIAPASKLLIGKVLGDNGSGRIEHIVAGIRWAIEMKVDYISLSLGTTKSHPGLFSAVHEAILKGITVLAAAGNEGNLGRNTIGYPGKYGSVISVGAHGWMGQPSKFTSRGGEIDFLAPGDNIRSTFKNKGYAVLSGTSMATPFAAGLVALLISAHKKRQGTTPINNPEDVRDHLMMMASHPDYFDPTSGYGPLLPYIYYDKPHP